MPNDDTIRLIQQRGPSPGRSYDVAQPMITIGREVGNDIVINDAEISRQHVRLTRQPVGVLVEDLGSTNGTYVNGEPLNAPRVLRAGDVLGLGDNVALAVEMVRADLMATLPAANFDPTPPPTMYDAPPLEPLAGPPPIDSTQPPPARGGWRWALAGCGCLLVFLCLGVLGGLAWYIDSNNLYCAWLGLCF